MTETKNVFESTNENFYEIVWNARHQFLMEKLQHIDDVFAALDAFTMTDVAYLWGPVGGSVEKEDGTTETVFYTGEVSLKPRPPEDTKRLQAIAAQTQNKRTELLLKYIEDDMDAIVELGAGYGLGLLRLAQVLRMPVFDGSPKRDIPLYMAEYTESGRALCAAFLKKANAPAMSLHPIDHKAPDVSFLAGRNKPLISTIHSIEQVERLPDDYFHTLAAAAPNVRGFHLEPVGFQFDQNTEARREHATYTAEQGWNQNFADVLRKAEADGVITVDTVDLDAFVIHESNPAALVTWRSRA